MALKKAWKAFENILPEFLVVILLVGFLLAILNPETISKIIGAESGWFGVILAGIIIIAYILSKMVSEKEVQTLYENAAKID